MIKFKFYPCNNGDPDYIGDVNADAIEFFWENRTLGVHLKAPLIWRWIWRRELHALDDEHNRVFSIELPTMSIVLWRSPVQAPKPVSNRTVCLKIYD